MNFSFGGPGAEVAILGRLFAEISSQRWPWVGVGARAAGGVAHFAAVDIALRVGGGGWLVGTAENASALGPDVREQGPVGHEASAPDRGCGLNVTPEIRIEESV